MLRDEEGRDGNGMRPCLCVGVLSALSLPKLTPLSLSSLLGVRCRMGEGEGASGYDSRDSSSLLTLLLSFAGRVSSVSTEHLPLEASPAAKHVTQRIRASTRRAESISFPSFSPLSHRSFSLSRKAGKLFTDALSNLPTLHKLKHDQRAVSLRRRSLRTAK